MGKNCHWLSLETSDNRPYDSIQDSSRHLTGLKNAIKKCNLIFSLSYLKLNVPQFELLNTTPISNTLLLHSSTPFVQLLMPEMREPCLAPSCPLTPYPTRYWGLSILPLTSHNYSLLKISTPSPKIKSPPPPKNFLTVLPHTFTLSNPTQQPEYRINIWLSHTPT